MQFNLSIYKNKYLGSNHFITEYVLGIDIMRVEILGILGGSSTTSFSTIIHIIIQNITSMYMYNIKNMRLVKTSTVYNYRKV